jgi:Mg-chelatase subunit ChlD
MQTGSSFARLLRIVGPILITLCLMACNPFASKTNSISFDVLEKRVEEPGKITLFFSLQTGEGEPVPNLPEKNFKLFEDDSELSDFESKRRFLNPEQDYAIESLLLLDMSGSIIESGHLPDLLDAAEDFVAEVAPGKQMAVAIFDGREDIQVVQGFTSNVSVLQEKIRGLKSHKVVDTSTNLYGAVVKALESLDKRSEDRPLYAAFLTVFTDGTHRAGTGGGYPNQKEVLKKVNASDHAVFTIGLGGEIDEAVLQSIGKNGFARADKIEDLADAFDQISKRLQDSANSYYALIYCSPARAGKHTFKVRVTWDELEGEYSFKFDAEGFSGGCRTD